MLPIGPECSTQDQMKRSMRPAGIQLWNAVNAAPRCVSPILTTGGRRAALPISPRTIPPSGVIATAVYDTLAKGSNVLNPLTSEFFPSEKMRSSFVRGQRLVDFGLDDVDRGPVRHEPRLIHVGLADTLKSDRLARCFQRQPDHLLEADVPVGCPPGAGFRLDLAGNLKAAALESQCGAGTEAQLVSNGDGYAPSTQSEHHRAALDRLTNGRDIDQAAHILL